VYNRQDGGAEFRAAESEELAPRLRRGMINPQSTAQELLHIREVLLSRLS
jgi:hypothetical protein